MYSLLHILCYQAALLWLCLPILLFTICALRCNIKGNSAGAALVEETAISPLKVQKPWVLEKCIERLKFSAEKQLFASELKPSE